MFFNENGILDIDGMLINNDSFKAIMEDGIVTEEEIATQSEKVLNMLRDIEKKYTTEQVEDIKSLLAESSVLFAIYNFYSIQSLNK